MICIFGIDLDIRLLVLGVNIFGWMVDEYDFYVIFDVFFGVGGLLVDIVDGYFYWVDGNNGGEFE